MKTKPRFRLFTQKNGQEIRDLLRVWTNAHGDVMLDVDNGETVQFTPRTPIEKTPSIDAVLSASQGKPRLSLLRMANGVAWGDVRVIPSSTKATPRTAPAKRAPVSLREKAAIFGKSVPTIRNWEAGRHTPEGYPAGGDAVQLKAFAGRMEEGARLKKVVLGAVRYGDIDDASSHVDDENEW